MGNSETIDQFPKDYVQIKREEHSILGNISYIFNKDTKKKYIMCQKVFMIENEYNICRKKIELRKQLTSSERQLNKDMINVMEIKCSQFSEICGKIFKINIFIQQFQSDLKKQFNERKYKSEWFSQKQIFQILQNITNNLITLYDNSIKSYHLSLDSIVSINGSYKMIDSDLTSKLLPIYDFLYQSKLKKGIYLSPEHIQLDPQFISDKNLCCQNPKSDIFTLGIVILQLMSLSDMYQVYDYTHKKIYFQIIQNRIKQLEKRYSQKLIKIIRLMVNEQQASRIGLLGLKQMIQVKSSAKEYIRQKKKEESYEVAQNQSQYIHNNKLEQNFKESKGYLQGQNSNYDQKRKNQKQNSYHRLYNNKLTTSRSKKSNSYYESQKLPQQHVQPYKIISYTKPPQDSNKQQQNIYIQHVKIQRNNLNLNNKTRRNPSSNDQILNIKNNKQSQKTINNYYTGSRQVGGSNNFQQQRKIMSINNQISRNSRISHSSDLPVSPITAINHKQVEINTIKPNYYNYNVNKSDLFLNKTQQQTTMINQGNNQKKSQFTGSNPYQAFISNHQHDWNFKNPNKNVSQQIFNNNFDKNAPTQTYNDIPRTYKDSSQTYNNPSLSYKQTYNNPSLSYKNYSQTDNNPSLSYKDSSQTYNNPPPSYNDKHLSEGAVETPKNINKKNIFSINTKQNQHKLYDVVDSSRSTPVKHLQLIQTNKKQYQQMNKTTFGRYDFSNGAIYEGQFNQNNQFEGNGVLYYPNGKICYSGGWFQNCFHSFGVLYNQQIITQTPTTHKPTNYKDFNKNDSNNWIQYEGEFVQDKKNGFGSLLMSNGDKFSGCFVNDIIQGFGTFYIKSTGQSINGIWVNNVLQK